MQGISKRELRVLVAKRLAWAWFCLTLGIVLFATLATAFSPYAPSSGATLIVAWFAACCGAVAFFFFPPTHLPFFNRGLTRRPTYKETLALFMLAIQALGSRRARAFVIMLYLLAGLYILFSSQAKDLQATLGMVRELMHSLIE
jgi:hypothetical protein